MKKKRLALLGYGKLNQIVGDAVKNGILEGYEIVGIMGRNPEGVKEAAEKYNCKPCTNIEELLALKPDFVAEAASGQALLDYAEIIVSSGTNIVLLSTSVLLDSNFFERLEKAATDKNVRIYLPGGRVGGFDLLHTATLMNPVEATITSKRGESSFEEINCFEEKLNGSTEVKRVFEGTAKTFVENQSISYNAMVPTAYVSVGPEKLKFSIDAIPDFIGDEYNIHVKGQEVELDLNIISKNQNIAAWSVVRMLQNTISTIVI